MLSEYLRIRRSVQALFNTEASYLAAQTVAARQGKAPTNVVAQPLDPMAAIEQPSGFVKATQETGLHGDGVEQEASTQPNEDEIQISDED